MSNSALLLRSEVYFAFGDGRLDYDCVTCGARCCRGNGYVLDNATLLHQIQMRPAVRFFVEADLRKTGISLMRNHVPDCFFLQEDGLCEIHVREGYAAKAETCRLFPFNSFVYWGDTLVVRPHIHLNICPLHVLQPGEFSHRSAHESIFEDLTRSPVQAHIPRANLPSPKNVVRLERDILEFTNSWDPARGLQDLVDTQLEIFESTQIDETAPRDRHNKLPRSNEVLPQMLSILGATDEEAASHDYSTLNVLSASIPSVRSRLWSGSDVEPSYFCKADVARLAPYFTLALGVIASLARAAGTRRATFQTISMLMTQHGPLAALLAMLHCSVDFDPDVSMACDLRGEDKQFHDAMYRLSRNVSDRGGAMLGHIVESVLSREKPDRLRFLRLLATKSCGKFRIY